MSLKNSIKVVRRFQRSIRIDADVGQSDALDGFICPKSSADVLVGMAQHARETLHTAFTWTGPYGSGKSSLVIALSALLGRDETLHRKAVRALGAHVKKEILRAFPREETGCVTVPVVGRRDDPVAVIGEALTSSGLISGSHDGAWTEATLLAELKGAYQDNRIVIFIDEMGKFLEGAALRGSDIYLFQQLAELASRSDGRLVVVGILHQAFDEYAHRLSREMRDEWSKIQGRYIDLPVNVAGEEQIELLSRAIESDHNPKSPGKLATIVANEIRKNRPAVSSELDQNIELCWPLHPVVASMLGPISRRRFGQNQRSVFGFLNSAEPFGFQEFLSSINSEELFGADRLWDYLKANLEPSILASPDGHRWAIAMEAIERCEVIGGEQIHQQLLKTIALIDLFKDRSGLVPSKSVLEAAYPEYSANQIERALGQLSHWSFIVYRKFSSSYAVFAGSDFDIETAVKNALEDIREIDFSHLQQLAGIQPILAKRHYHETGTLRWFDVSFASVSETPNVAIEYAPKRGAIGLFLLAIPTNGETEEVAGQVCREAARNAETSDIVVGLSHRGWVITDLAREVLALEQVRDDSPELAGDAVARREIQGRIASLQGQLEMELQGALDNAIWYVKHRSPKRQVHSQLNILASELASKRFPDAPIIHNELLNRTKPSSNAIAAQNALLRLMVINEGSPRLGIEGYPAEGGLFASLLEASNLYAEGPNGWFFRQADELDDDTNNLGPLWHAAKKSLEENRDRAMNLSEIYDIWRSEPFGVKDGLLPVLAVAFILSCRNSVAFYRLGIFQARFRDLDTEYLARDPSEVQLRWMDLTEFSRRLLSGMADVVRELDEANQLTDLTPIDVARGLISIHDGLKPWVKRTNRLSANATHIRGLFKHANDPNKLLFNDIPSSLRRQDGSVDEESFEALIGEIRGGLKELIEAYPAMLRRVMDSLLSELLVPNASPQALAELRSRAENIKQLSGDFQLDAFIGRISTFQGLQSDVEGLLSLAANKPLRDWVDPDLDRASVELADLAQRFLRAETFARVKGRADKRHAMAVVVGINGHPTPLVSEFHISDEHKNAVDKLVVDIQKTLSSAKGLKREVLLAALAETSAALMTQEDKTKRNKRKAGRGTS
ncbi:ATP-binding protein [Roseibium album]|uniref:ATP-binding protein n=1 Tax=Roseibium album TaxID=311410 RepID=UPI003BB050A7